MCHKTCSGLQSNQAAQSVQVNNYIQVPQTMYDAGSTFGGGGHFTQNFGAQPLVQPYTQPLVQPSYYNYQPHTVSIHGDPLMFNQPMMVQDPFVTQQMAMPSYSYASQFTNYHSQVTTSHCTPCNSFFF